MDIASFFLMGDRRRSISPGCQIRCQAVLPAAWKGGAASSTQGEISAKAEGPLSLGWKIPLGTNPGRYVIPIDLDYGDWQLPRFSEAIVDVEAG